MGDFHQNGIITTLHNLSKRPLEDMESELVEFPFYSYKSLFSSSLFKDTKMGTPELFTR